MLEVKAVALHVGERLLFDELTVTVHHGHKVGVVGRNGVGKSTFFDLLRRRVLPEAGVVLWPQAWRVACLDQSVAPSPRSALDFVLDGDKRLRRIEGAIAAAQAAGADERLAHLYGELEDAGGYHAHARAGEILHGLGFAGADFDKPHRAFSGGWRIRLNLAQALMAPSDLLLLDEPTNHLDLEATLWLEAWVRKYPGTLLAIAHDRDFLDKTVQAVVHVDRGRATMYTGNYSAFERQRAEALAQQAALHKQQQRRVQEIRRFVDRFRAKDSKAKQVQSRLKALQRMELAAPVLAESPYRFVFSEPRKISNPILQLDDAALGYGGPAVLGDVTLRVYSADRIGVLGANGAGKTTLLRCLAGELAPQQGRLGRGPHSAVGYFAQHQLESLDPDRTPLEQLLDQTAASGQPRFGSQAARDYLGGWGLTADHANRPAGTLSGGEKARLVLALLACAEPAVLVLDEPTNHLDLEMREALALALQQYRGALLLVSHDRHLLRRCVDSFWLLAEGRVQPFQGDLENYAGYVQNARRRGAKVRQRPPHPKPDGRARLRSKAHPPSKVRRQLNARRRQLEAEVDRYASAIQALEERLGDAAVDNAADDLAQLAKEHEEARAAAQRAERAWLDVEEALDRLDRDADDTRNSAEATIAST